MLRIPGTIHKIETMADGGLKLVVYTQELHPESEAEVLKLKRQLGFFVFAISETITEKDIPNEQLEFPNDKSPAQRQRAVYYRLWEQNQEAYREFEGYYRAKMNNHIEKLKEGLV